MAEEGGNEAAGVEAATTSGAGVVGGVGWWGNLVSAAKTKSVEVFEFMKRDFDEFSSTVKAEATMIANQTASAVKEKLQLDIEESPANNVKKSVSSFFGTVKEALSPSRSQEFDEALVIQNGNPVAMSKLQKKIHVLVSDDATYLMPVEESLTSQYDAWLGVTEETLNSVDRLTHLLSVNPTLQDKYTNLVPTEVSHTEFWRRYLFKKAVLEDSEAEAERRLERDRKHAEQYPWQAEEELIKSVGDLELSEEEQIRILTEYEQEKNGGTSPTKFDTSSGKHEGEKVITVKEKKDLVIVSTNNNNTDASQASSSSKASTDGDWEKEFDLDEGETSSPTSPELVQAVSSSSVKSSSS